MPKRHDIQSILLLGAGPIVIGQACEFDYSGTQALKALKEEGCRVILVNSNPASIMTEPSLADATYIEPLCWQEIARIIEKERPDAIMPNMGGQTALNCVVDLDKAGILTQFGVEVIGISLDSIHLAEDRKQFRDLMLAHGFDMPRSLWLEKKEDLFLVEGLLGFPVLARSSYNLGGLGGQRIDDLQSLEVFCESIFSDPLHASGVLLDELLLAWKEYEFELLRDALGNCIVVCAIENIDPLGVHTGDSMTVSPVMTLTDKEFQCMRDAAIQILSLVGLAGGGANVQFAFNPKDGRQVVIEMNPRVSRSSALASKATGVPIAKIAAKLALGYTLDELDNEVCSGVISAAFEPSMDYVVVKLPRFNFDKFPNSDQRLGFEMKSLGEVMAIGEHFQAALQKAIRALEIGREGLVPLFKSQDRAQMLSLLRTPSPDRLWIIADAFRMGWSIDEVHHETGIDAWFLSEINELVEMEALISTSRLEEVDVSLFKYYKSRGFSDARLADLLNCDEFELRKKRLNLSVLPVYKRIDSCAGEFAATTPYLYATYQSSCEANPDPGAKIMILGSGPNRIAQGIEFDYCCVQASYALREMGIQSIMVNSNPETVSTDFHTADRLYFEPLGAEEVLAIAALEKPSGIIIQCGGQTALKLAEILLDAGWPILGTSIESIDIAEDRARFSALLARLELKQAAHCFVYDYSQAAQSAEYISYPLIVRPSYVLGGSAVALIKDEVELHDYFEQYKLSIADKPILLEQFLKDAIEVDVDAVCDGEQVLIAGIMEHIEPAGIHSGDSACVLPPLRLSASIQKSLIEQVELMARTLALKGFVNIQFALKSDDIYVLELNPRASRTLPFVSKARGLDFVNIATRCMLGQSLKQQAILSARPDSSFYTVKMPVFPFTKFSALDCVLGPEMKSTGEVMAIGACFEKAYAKALRALASVQSKRLRAFLSVRDDDKLRLGVVAKRLVGLGFELLASPETFLMLQVLGIQSQCILDTSEDLSYLIDAIKNQEIDFIVDNREDKLATEYSLTIRSHALQFKVRYTSVLSAAEAISLAKQYEDRTTITCLQDLHKR